MKKILLILLIFGLLISCSKENNVSLNNSKKIIALGDSLTGGYGVKKEFSYPSQLNNLLNENGYKYEIINAGISGNTSEQLLNRIDKFYDIEADIYLINIGANDGLRKMNLDKMQKNIESIISYIQKTNPNGKIILFGIKLPITLGLHYSSNFNSRFEKIAEEYNIKYYGNFLEGVNGIGKLNLSDRMHPNKDGYEIISNNIFNYLKENNFLKIEK